VPLQETGVAANINLAHVDLDAWQKLLGDSSVRQRAAAPPPAAATAAPTAPPRLPP
jgi:uncharacterized protein YhdP